MSQIVLALESLLNLDKPIAQIREELDRLEPYMDHEYYVALTRQHLISILQRYIQGLLSYGDICSWLSKILNRCDQINYEKGYHDLILDVLDTLDEYCDPDMTFSTQRAQALIDQLKTTPFDPDD